MKILLTGSTGFIGKAVSSLLENKRCVVREGYDSKERDIYFVKSINGSTNWHGAFDGVDAIIHLAGAAHGKVSSPKDFYDINLDGTINLANSAIQNGVKRFVFVSSIGVNGISTSVNPFTHTSAANPHNDYAKSKYLAEQALFELAQETELEVVVVRPTLVYGPGAPGNFRKLKKLVQTIPVLPFRMVKNKRHFISVYNLADLLITCASHNAAPGQVFLASDGVSLSTRELIDEIAVGLNKRVMHLPIPTRLMISLIRMFGLDSSVTQLFDNLEVDSSNLRSLLDWTPPYSIRYSMKKLTLDN